MTVYEAVEDPHPVGAGIMIQPTGMAVLARLGLLERILRRGAPVRRLLCTTPSGRAVIDLEYEDLDPNAFGLGLHRGALFEALFDAAAVEPGVELKCGVPVLDLTRVAKNKRGVITPDGERHGAHDLIVVADGARSQLRDDTLLTTREDEYPWGALWFIGKDTERQFDDTLTQVVEGTHHLLGLLPCGLGPEGQTPLVSLFWSVHGEAVDAWREAGLAAWKATVMRLEPRAAPLLAQIESADQLLYARYFDVVLTTWHADGVVYLGDAAHATSPQLGQGANLALMDAMVLADALADAPNLREGITAYSDMRGSHLDYYQWATRFLTPFFQSDHEALGALRDLFMGIACKLPYVRRRMIQTMCGLERGVLGLDTLPLPELPRTATAARSAAGFSTGDHQAARGEPSPTANPTESTAQEDEESAHP